MVRQEQLDIANERIDNLIKQLTGDVTPVLVEDEKEVPQSVKLSRTWSATKSRLLERARLEHKNHEEKKRKQVE